jgi:hypothetical protein
MKALRLPAPASPVAYWFRSRGPRYPRSFVSRRSAPKEARGRFQGLVPWSAGGPSPAGSRMDEHGISQVPRRSLPCLCPAPRPRSNQPDLAILRSRRCCPRGENDEGFGGREFRGLPLGFSTRCLRFTKTVASSMQSSLPAGWLPLPAGSRTPCIATKGFRSSIFPPFPSSFPGLVLTQPHCLTGRSCGAATGAGRQQIAPTPANSDSGN